MKPLALSYPVGEVDLDCAQILLLVMRIWAGPGRSQLHGAQGPVKAGGLWESPVC